MMRESNCIFLLYASKVGVRYPPLQKVRVNWGMHNEGDFSILYFVLSAFSCADTNRSNIDDI